MDLTKYHYYTDEKGRLCSVDLVSGDTAILPSKGTVSSVTVGAFNKEIAIKVCHLVREGHTISQIANMPNMPTAATIYQWARAVEEFQIQLDYAKEDRAHVYFDKIIDQAESVTEASEVKVAALKIDTYKYLAEKTNKQSYGREKDVGGVGNVSIIISTGIPDQPAQVVNAECKVVEAKEEIDSDLEGV